MFDDVQATVDLLCGHAIEGAVDLAEFFCPALTEFLSWDLAEPALSYVVDEEWLPANIATVFPDVGEIVQSWWTAASAVLPVPVLEQAAGAA